MAWPTHCRWASSQVLGVGRALSMAAAVAVGAAGPWARAADAPAAPALNIPAAGAQRGPTQVLPASGRPDLPRLPEQASPAFAVPAGSSAVSGSAAPVPAAGASGSAGSGSAGGTSGAAQAPGGNAAGPPGNAAGVPSAAGNALGNAAAGSASGTSGNASAAAPSNATGNAPAAGITQAIHDLKLSVTAAGRIEALFVKEGDRVRKGDLLLHMDRALESLEVRRREVMLEDNARLDELRAKELTLTEQVRSARTLLTTGGVSRKQVEDEELALGTIIAERKSIEFAKRRERVELDLAREAYERRHLRSPIDGMVTRIVSRIGESVAPHEPVMVVVDVRTVRFSGTVPIADVSRVRAGSSVVLQLGSDVEPVRRLAHLVFVSPVADPASGLVDVIAEFDNADGSIRPGTAGRIVGASATSALPGAPANRVRR